MTVEVPTVCWLDVNHSALGLNIGCWYVFLCLHVIESLLCLQV